MILDKMGNRGIVIYGIARFQNVDFLSEPDFHGAFQNVNEFLSSMGGSFFIGFGRFEGDEKRRFRSVPGMPHPDRFFEKYPAASDRGLPEPV